MFQIINKRTLAMSCSLETIDRSNWLAVYTRAPRSWFCWPVDLTHAIHCEEFKESNSKPNLSRFPFSSEGMLSNICGRCWTQLNLNERVIIHSLSHNHCIGHKDEPSSPWFSEKNFQWVWCNESRRYYLLGMIVLLTELAKEHKWYIFIIDQC